MWQSWTLLQQIYFCIALLFSVILLVQFILLLVGAGTPGDVDADFDTDGVDFDDGSSFFFFSIKGLIAFFAIGGWTGFSVGATDLHPAWIIVISLAAGLLAMVIVNLIMRAIASLSQDGSMKISNAVGKTGEVYLTIPPSLSGTGKINVDLQGTLTELDAMTESDTPIKTGAKVKVVRTDDSTCYVEII